LSALRLRNKKPPPEIIERGLFSFIGGSREINFVDLSFPRVTIQKPLIRSGFLVYTFAFEN